MIKRTMGLSLLGLLVISGLAGRLTNNSLTKPERKKALSMMKETKSSLLEQVSELSKNQWLFKPASKNRNIQEYIIHIAATENKLWRLLEQAMKTPSSQARRSAVELNDEELIRLAENQSEAMIACDPFPVVLKNNKKFNFDFILQLLLPRTKTMNTWNRGWMQETIQVLLSFTIKFVLLAAK